MIRGGASTYTNAARLLAVIAGAERGWVISGAGRGAAGSRQVGRAVIVSVGEELLARGAPRRVHGKALLQHIWALVGLAISMYRGCSHVKKYKYQGAVRYIAEVSQ